MTRGFVVGFQLGFRLGRGDKFDLRVSKGKGGRVPLLARRLVLLIGLFASTIELATISHVKIAFITTIRLAVDLIDC